MSSFVVKLAVVMAQSSSLAASGYVTYTQFKPAQWVKWFFTKFLPRKLEQLFNLFIKLIFDALKDIKKALLKILTTIWNAIKAGFKLIKNQIEGIAKKIAKGFMMVIKKIEKAFTDMFNKIKRAFTKIISTISNGVKKIPKQITNAGKKVIGQVSGAGKKVIKSIGNSGKKIVNKIAGSGKRAIQQIDSGFKNMGKAATKAIRKAPAEGAKQARRQFAKLFRMR